MEISLQSIQDYLPYYLTDEDKKAIAHALDTFPAGFQYYCSGYEHATLQGDGWYGFQVFNFFSGEKAGVYGIVLSNSCDISPENSRNTPIKITFAPLMRLASFKRALHAAGVADQVIESKMASIRRQENTELFYLPALGAEDEDFVAVLSDLHSMPHSVFADSTVMQKRFTLSMYGFYLFLMKLSIHFCRFQEKLDRSEALPA